MADLEQFRSIYFDECAELLSSAEEGLLSLDSSAPDHETINAIFRAVHSVKGGGGAFGFATLVDFAHRFEAVLNDLRNDRIVLSRALVDSMIQANDVLGALILAAKDNQPPDEEMAAGVMESLKAIAYGTGGPETDPGGGLPTAEEANAAQAFLDAAFAEAGDDEAGDDGVGNDGDATAPYFDADDAFFSSLGDALDPDRSADLPDPSAADGDPGAKAGADRPAIGATGHPVWKIDFRPKPDLVRFGNEPLHLIRALRDLGAVVVRCSLDGLPDDPTAFDPESVYLAWEIFLEGAVAPPDIREVFEFAADEADIDIEPADLEEYAFARGWDVDYTGDEAAFLESFHAADPDAAGSHPAGPDAAGPDAIGPDATGPDTTGPDVAGPDAAPASPAGRTVAADRAANDAAAPVAGPVVETGGDTADAGDHPAPPAPSGRTAAPSPEAGPGLPARQGESVRTATVAAPTAGKGPGGAGGRPVLGGQTIRVDLEKIDKLVNLVGEMVITQAMIAEQTRAEAFAGSTELIEGLDDLAQHTRELQDSVMAIRAQPVSSVFNRMPRLVREVATETGKDVQLIVTGEGTEVDKTVVELLADPLVHMIRNSIDHGLEATADRIAAGKPATGRVRLSAEHRSGRILIQVSDDGRGINRDRVLAKAREKGLIAPDAEPSEEEIDNMIFLPGFSTADRISEISGRGVGMDVVSRNIQALGGRIVVQSTPGEGSVFTLSLPLTLAVLDGMVVRIADQRFVVPLTNIVESLRPTAAQVTRMVDGNAAVKVRGEYVRVVPVWRLFAIANAVEAPEGGLVVIAETEEGGRIGLLVDDIVGQQQVVIKSLEANFHQLPGVSSATILGDGRVALILDIAGLREFSRKKHGGGRPSGRLIDGPVGAGGVS